MRLWLLLLLEVGLLTSQWLDFLKLLNPQRDILEDAPDCGVLGTKPSRGRQSDGGGVAPEECLWGCEWRPNPWFKQGDVFLTQWNEGTRTLENTFILLYTSPQLPRDLNCLQGCFERYTGTRSNQRFLDKVRQNCSANSLDRLVPTHTRDAVTFTESRFADMSLFVKAGGRIASLNPNLDCMLYHEKEIRKDTSELGNFISDKPLSDVLLNESNEKRNNPNSKDPYVTLDFLKIIQRFHLTPMPEIVFNRQNLNVSADEGLGDIDRFVFRASNPVTTAIEICALAKYISFLKSVYDLPELSSLPPVPTIFSATAPTCDHFLPDIFAPICRCVGTCSSNINWKPGDIQDEGKARPINLLRYFYSDNDATHKPGLWSCWNACNSNSRCTHYTLSRVTETDSRFYHNQKAGAPDVNLCFLWTNCDKFNIPEDTTDYFGKGSNKIKRTNLIISDHWSGAKNCDTWKESCPLLTGRSYKGRSPWRKKNNKGRNKKRVFGQSTSPVNPINKFPWVCSLKEAGFTGRHRCGVTLLSGKETSEVVLVSSAHCNYICKDDQNVVEICCCRQPNLPESCKNDSSYCGLNPMLVSAKPSELQIVCGEHSLQIKPEVNSDENEVVLRIDKIANNPRYTPGTMEDKGADLKGPYAGFDIAVYHLTQESKVKIKGMMKREELWPACLPKKEYTSNRGIFAGWLDQEPFYRTTTNRISVYERTYQLLKMAEVEYMTCRDPTWMRSIYNQKGTFYPAATECYRDTTQASCFLFGNSGSGVVRKFTPLGMKERYAFTGPLSMSKSCDSIWIVDQLISYSSENPGVFTDAYCNLPWIASEYGMALPQGYRTKESCTQSRGLRQNIDQPVCMGQDTENLDRGRSNLTQPPDNGVGRQVRECDFSHQFTNDKGKTETWNKCRLFSQEGYAYNIYICKDKGGNNMTCANNCRGVDPNAVIIGGSAVLAAAAITTNSFLLPALGLGAGVGGLGLAMTMGQCATGQCMARDARNPRRRKCCNVRGSAGGGRRCPARC